MSNYLIVAPTAVDGVPYPAARAGGWYALGAGDPARAERMAAPYLASGEYDAERALVAHTDWTPPWSGDTPPVGDWPCVAIITQHEGRIVPDPVPWAAPFFFNFGASSVKP